MINKVILVGNLGKDPEVRTMSNSKQVATFSLATTESWNDKNTGERASKTEWHNIVIFNEPLVKVVQNYVFKGSRIYIEGCLQTRKWTDGNGNDRYTTEVVLNQYTSTLKILTAKGQQAGSDDQAFNSPAQQMQSQNTTSQAQEQKPNLDSGDLDDDDIPF